MIFFFHHYELPAILSRGHNIAAEDDILEDQLDVLNQPQQNNQTNSAQPESGVQNDASTNPGSLNLESLIQGTYFRYHHFLFFFHDPKIPNSLQ